MVIRFSLFLYRHFWALMFVACSLLTGTVATKMQPHHALAMTSKSEQALLQKLQGLSAENVRSLNIMARTVYGETRNQGPQARTAVAHVILNRSKNKSNIAQVIFKRKQFSCWDDHNRRAMLSASTNDSAFIASLDACVTALKSSKDITHGADHYHAVYTKPYWSRSRHLRNIGRFGAHIFYKKR